MVAAVLLSSTPTGVARAEEAPLSSRFTPIIAATVWTIAELIPSPLLVTGQHHVGGGVRWQVTPLLFSFGVAEKPFRSFVIEPVARHTGAIEIYGSPEWACCATGDKTSWIARAGTRMYLPLIGRGEALSASLGGSYYFAGDRNGVAFEAGAYVLFGTLGLTVTVSPWLERREVISALSIRYF